MASEGVAMNNNAWTPHMIDTPGLLTIALKI
jgi:hypothetical protein